MTKVKQWASEYAPQILRNENSSLTVSFGVGKYENTELSTHLLLECDKEKTLASISK